MNINLAVQCLCRQFAVPVDRVYRGRPRDHVMDISLTPVAFLSVCQVNMIFVPKHAAGGQAGVRAGGQGGRPERTAICYTCFTNLLH